MAEPKNPKKGGDKAAKGGDKAAKGAEKTAKAKGAETVAHAGAVAGAPEGYVARMRKHYDEVVRPQMIEQFGYKNPLEVPAIEKIVLNMGVGEAVNDTKKVTVAAADLALIAGQKPVITKARNAISTFKVRENMPIGAKVTLRKTRMYEFLDRLVTVALAAGERFPRSESEVVRRPRQFRHGRQGAHRVPGDRLRQGRHGSGHGRHRLHHGQDRRRGSRSAARVQLPVPAVRQVR